VKQNVPAHQRRVSDVRFRRLLVSPVSFRCRSVPFHMPDADDWTGSILFSSGRLRVINARTNFNSVAVSQGVDKGMDGTANISLGFAED
jgi:hypothetical protein